MKPEICIDCQSRVGTIEIPCDGTIYYRCDECDANLTERRGGDRDGANDLVENEDK